MKNKIFTLIILTIAMIVAIITLWKVSLVATIVVFLISLALLWRFYEKRYLILYIFIGVMGTFIEYILTFFGVWTHASQGVSGVPYWIPFVWGYTGLASALFAEWLKNGK